MPHRAAGKPALVGCKLIQGMPCGLEACSQRNESSALQGGNADIRWTRA